MFLKTLNYIICKRIKRKTQVFKKLDMDYMKKIWDNQYKWETGIYAKGGKDRFDKAMINILNNKKVI